MRAPVQTWRKHVQIFKFTIWKGINFTDNKILRLFEVKALGFNSYTWESIALKKQ